MKKILLALIALLALTMCAAAADHASEQWGLRNDGSFSFTVSWYEYVPGTDSKGQSVLTAEQHTRAYGSAEGVDVDAEGASQVYDPCAEVVLAIIDTGVDYSHSDFGEVFWTNDGEIPGNRIDDDGNGYVDDYLGYNFYDRSGFVYTDPDADAHGTHCAGTIVATAGNGFGVDGLASDGSIKIMILKVLGANGQGGTQEVAEAIRYAEANGARVVNLSFSTWDYDADLYEAMAGSDMLFVCAAGNDAVDLDWFSCYPTAFKLDNLISVAGLNPDGTLFQNSNTGKASVGLAAPALGVVGLLPENGFAYQTGTSMAAPFVSAAAAMLMAQNPLLDAPRTAAILLESAKPLPALDGLVSSGGMLDVAAALRAAGTPDTYYNSILSGLKTGLLSSLGLSLAADGPAAVKMADIMKNFFENTFDIATYLRLPAMGAARK